MNRKSYGILALFFLTLMATSAVAAEMFAGCPGDGTVYLRVRFWDYEMGADWQGVVVERSIVGECGTGIILNDEPLQLLEGYNMGDYELFYPLPSSTTTYRYAIKGMDASGALVDMTGGEYAPTWFYIRACSDEGLMMRGTLTDIGHYGRVGITLCSDACWDICPGPEATVGVINLDAGDYQQFLGTDTVVNVYGVWDSNPPEVSWGCMNAVRIEEVASCSGSVPLQRTSWGTFKAFYR